MKTAIRRIWISSACFYDGFYTFAGVSREDRSLNREWEERVLAHATGSTISHQELELEQIELKSEEPSDS